MRPIVGALVLLAASACGRDQRVVDTGGRSLDVPVPATGIAGQSKGAERDLFDFPRRPKQDARSLGVRTGPLGAYLVDATGRALYSFSDDADGQTACLTNCATVWPPVIVERLPTSNDAAIDAARLALATRPDGTRQLTYGGRPLYYSESDLKPGDAWGHYAMSFGGRFTLVSPDGTPLPAPR